jgi:hypothetical protein
MSLLEVPFRLTFETDRFGEPYPAGAMGIALAVAIPLALVFLIRRGEKRGETLLALAVFSGSLAAWDLSFRGLRHGFPLLSLAAVLAVGAVETLSTSGKARRFQYGMLAAMLAAQVALVPVLFWNIPERLPLARALGRESETEFLSRALPSYPAVAYLNRTAATDEKILGAAAANLRFYLRPRVDTVGETWELQEAVKDIRGGELAGKLLSMGYRRIFLAGVQPSVQPGYPFLDPAFLAAYAELEFEAGTARVYRLLPLPAGEGGVRGLKSGAGSSGS